MVPVTSELSGLSDVRILRHSLYALRLILISDESRGFREMDFSSQIYNSSAT
jgi:hypothetical protein